MRDCQCLPVLVGSHLGEDEHESGFEILRANEVEESDATRIRQRK